MEKKNIEAVRALEAEIFRLEQVIQQTQKAINQQKTLIAALICGFGIGDIVTDGGTVFLVNSFSGTHWKGFRRKHNGTYSENEDYIKGEFKKLDEPIEININKEP